MRLEAWGKWNLDLSHTVNLSSYPTMWKIVAAHGFQLEILVAVSDAYEDAAI